MTSPCFSQPDSTAKTKINKAELICLPDSVLRKVANELVLYDQCASQRTVLNLSIDYLNQIITSKDSLLFIKESEIKAKGDIIGLYMDKNSIQNTEIKEMQKKYSQLKINDRLKMGTGAAIICLLVYAWIVKH